MERNEDRKSMWKSNLSIPEIIFYVACGLAAIAWLAYRDYFS